jgi:hypothetical protein
MQVLILYQKNEPSKHLDMLSDWIAVDKNTFYIPVRDCQKNFSKIDQSNPKIVVYTFYRHVPRQIHVYHAAEKIEILDRRMYDYLAIADLYK